MLITRVRSLEELERIRLTGTNRLEVVGDVDRAAVLALPQVKQALGHGLEIDFLSDDELLQREAAFERERHARDARAEAAWKQAHARGALSMPPTPASARLVAPPLGADALPDVEPPRAVTGAMEGFTGDACDRSELSWGDDRLEPRLARRVCAWHVPRLIGQGFAAESEAGLAGALRALLHQQLGPLPFHVDEKGGWGGPWKYLHVHANVVAPPIGDVPMGLEIFASILGLGEHDFAAEAGARWLVRRGRKDQSPLPGPLWMHVEAATYSNIMFPGVGVPFYM